MKRSLIVGLLLPLLCLAAPPGLVAQEVREADICVFGGTAGGVAAAVQAARMGKTVVLISHRTGVLALADRVLVLRDGAVVQEGPMDDEMRRTRSYL